MTTSASELIALEKKFWQTLVDNDTEAAVDMITEPSMMVSAYGTMKFDREAFRKMAKEGSMVVKSFELSDMNVLFPNDATAVVTYKAKQVIQERGKSASVKQAMADSSVWTRERGKWRCVIHTETPINESVH